MYETMITALREQQDDPREAQAYLDKQLAHTDRINKENLKQLEDQYTKKYENINKDLKNLQLENDKVNQEAREHKIEMERREKECVLKLQEALLTEREQTLKIKLLQDEKEQMRKEISLLHQKLKDQNEISAIKTTRLEEKLKFRESMDINQNSGDLKDLSVLSVTVPTSQGFGRSQSPKVGNVAKYQQLKQEHKVAVKEYKRQIAEKDGFIKELLLEKEEYEMKINELENTFEYLQEQLELVQQEKETNEQLYETKLKRKENEYLQTINILDSEKQNAKNMLSHLQSIISNNEGPNQSVVKKLNFSICLNSSEKNKMNRFQTFTTPNSPSKNFNSGIDNLQSRNRLKKVSSNQNLLSNGKCRSRNPSSSGLNLVANSIPIKSIRANTMYRELNRSGHLKTLKQLASHKNLKSISHLEGYNEHTNQDGLAWFEQNIEGVQHEKGFTLDSSQNKYNQGENGYKRS